MPFLDHRGKFGPAGTWYADYRYNDQNDYDVWTDPAVMSTSAGLNPKTGQPWTRADAEFGSYAARAQAAGAAEAARQAAEDDDGLGDILGVVALGAAIYFTAGAASGVFGAEAIGAEAVAGEFATEAWAANAAAVESASLANVGYIDALGGLTDATGTALQGWSDIATASSQSGVVMDGIDFYNVDPGPDPFATTADVNAGWSYDGGYPGVDWYNSAGIGEASAPATLNDIFSNVSKAIKSAGSILAGAQQLANGQNRVQPNLTRSAGQMNLALPLILGAAYFAFRG